ncbi:MAG TPA: adenylate cyclase regulatory domain-containing protein [Candidatus Limnocylindrales bacterium]|nr:adenylate cyclase regulatory domain-containing protein [Candidatus Limnocylindrales bacterium]
MTPEDFAAAGLYDPDAPNAPGRLELLVWLTERGITIEQMLTHRHRALTGLAGDLALRPGKRISAREISTRVDMSLDEVVSLALAAGMSPAKPDDPVFTEADLALFSVYRGGSALFGETATRRFTRVVASSLSRIAEAAVTLFQANVEQPILEGGGSELTVAKRNLQAIESLEGVRSLIMSLFSVHVETAIRRLREARVSRSTDHVIFAVGFVDLVGFTTLTQRMVTRELADLVERFEETAYDVVAAHDGRVVKLIGDEVMYVTRSAGAACRVALTLLERFASDAAVTPRGAVAYGEMLLRGGDYYGPIVNLASRVAQVAVPSELLVTSEVKANAACTDVAFEPAGRRMLKGFDDPVVLYSATRAPA